MNNLLAVIGSYTYIFLIILTSEIVKKKTEDEDLSRKIVHILVGNWVFFIPLFEDKLLLSLVPLSFVFINYMALRFKIFKGMAREKDNYGTVYYAISIVVLVLLAEYLKMKALPYLGVLIMAYGDGLACLVGKKFGGKKIANSGKSYLGSSMVLVASFIVTILVAFTFNRLESLGQSPSSIILAAGLTAIISTFTELTGKDGFDNLSLPLIAGIFSSLMLYRFSLGLLVYLGFCSLILVFAYKKESIDLLALLTAILVGTLVYTLGSMLLAYSMLVFFIVGSIASKVKNEEKRSADALEKSAEARGVSQVLANSLPAIVALLFRFQSFRTDVFLLLAYINFAGALADTLASEIGKLTRGRTISITRFKEVERGLSGGVSILGLVSSFLGAFIISLFAFWDLNLLSSLYVLLFGFLSALIDSVLGDLLQVKYISDDGIIREKQVGKNDYIYSGFHFIDNNMVNLLSLSIASLLAFVFVSMI